MSTTTTAPSVEQAIPRTDPLVVPAEQARRVDRPHTRARGPLRSPLRTLITTIRALGGPSGPDAVVSLARTIPSMETYELVRLIVSNQSCSTVDDRSTRT